MAKGQGVVDFFRVFFRGSGGGAEFGGEGQVFVGLDASRVIEPWRKGDQTLLDAAALSKGPWAGSVVTPGFGLAEWSNQLCCPA